MDVDEAVITEFVATLRRMANVLEHAQKTGKPSSPLVPTQVKAFPTLEGQWLNEIVGEVVTTPETREVETSSGPTPITNFELTDGKKKIRVGVWGELGANLSLRIGDIVTLTNMKIGQPYEGLDQISSTRNTKIE